MRKVKLFFTMLMLIAFSVGNVWAVTFTANSDVNATRTITKGGVTLTLSSGCPVLNNYSEYRIYSGANFTVSSSSEITGIVITTNTAKGDATKLTAESGYTASGTSGTWTGSSNSVQFTADGSQVRILSIEVTIVSSCEKKVTISKGTPSHGDFTLSADGEQATCDGNVQVVVTPTPAEHYKVTGVSAPNSSSISTPDEDGKYTVTYAQNTNAASEINVTFTLKDQHTVTWNNHGIETTSQVYDDEKPVFPSPNPTSCDATSTTFIGWATTAWDGKLANTDGKTVYTSASAMPDVTGAVTYYAVYAKATAGTPVPHDGPSFSRSSSSNTITSGYTFTSSASANTDNYQDQSTVGNTSFVGVYHTTSAIFSSTPNSILVTAKIGGGTGNRDLANPVCAQLLDDKGAPIGQAVEITSHITTNTGDDYVDIEIPTTGITSANGVRISHVKESGYNVRFYSFSLSYTTGGTTYSDYMTTCAAAGTCEAPSFSPAAGTFDVAQDITLQTSTPSAHIYYTLDGTDPDDGSDEYSTPIHITQNTTIKAITYADGLTESSISEGVFNIRYAQPTFSPAGGAYNAVQNVTISAAEADAIYYTTNGEDPTVDPANLYDGSAIAINTTGSHTIKAIAVKAGYANSNVASATYVMDLPYGSIAEFVTAKPNTAKDLVFEEADNCVITGINGKSVYVQDASGKGMIIYNNSGYGTLEFHEGDRIVGTVNGKYQAFNGQHEMSLAVFAEGVTFTAVSRPTPVPVTAIDETAFNANTQILVKIEDLYYKSSSDKTHKFATTEGGSTEYTIYDQFGMLSGKTMPEASVACDLIGILSRYNATYQLLPILATDIAADADAADPTVSPAGGADAENAVTAAAVEITAAANTKVDGQASKTVDINSAIPTEVTVEVTRDFYRSVNFSCGWYKAAAAKYNINGQGATTEGEVVAKVAGVAAATAAEGDEVHVYITPEAHFHLATILVNGVAPATVTAGEEYSFTMPGEAVTIAVTWTEDAKYALTFTAGEGSGDAPAISGNEYYAGEVIPLPANTFTYDAQHKFTKWLIGGVEYAAGVNYTMPAAPAEAVAQWKTIPAFASGDWILVEDVAELTEGSYVIIAAEEYNYAMVPYASGNNCGRAEAVKDGKLLTYNAAFAIFEIKNFVQEEVVTGKSFLDVTNETYLYSASSTSNHLKAKATQDVYTAWDIEISEGTLTAFNKGNTAYEIQYNTDGMFSCYKSTQQAIALYKYHDPSLKLSYDANAGGDAVTHLPGMQVADNEGKVTVSSEVPLRAGYLFDGWKDGESNDYAAGDVITLSANMTLYAQWRTPDTYYISYDANGGTLIEGESEITPNPASVTEGDAYTVEDNVYELAGKLFLGWQAGGVLYNEGQEIHPTEDMAFVAQWGDPTVTDFILVTDVNQLQDGDKVYIAAVGYDVALGTQNSGNYRNPVEIEKQNNRVVILNATPVELTIGKVGDNFTFKDGENYIAWSSGNTLTNEASETNNSTWTIEISEGVTTIANKADSDRKLQYNSSSPRFAAYTSSQKAVAIYKKADYTRAATEGRYGTICLPQAGQIIGATLYEVADKDDSKIYFDEILNGQMEAGKPYIFLPNSGESQLAVLYTSDEEKDVQPANGLVGFIGANADAETEVPVGMYILNNNQYRLVEHAGSAKIKSYRSYIDLSGISSSMPAPGRRRISMSYFGSQVATGIENAEANEAPRKVLINGEMFIIRGEKMYDAKGQLVK